MKLSWANKSKGIPGAFASNEMLWQSWASTPRSSREEDTHPGIYRRQSLETYGGSSDRTVVYCSYCLGSGCGRCDLTGRVCARAPVVPSSADAQAEKEEEDAMYLYSTRGIFSTTPGASDGFRKPFDCLAMPQTPPEKAEFARRRRSDSMPSRDSPRHLSDSDSISGKSGSGGATTASEGRFLDSPPTSEASPMADSLENSSDSGRSADRVCSDSGSGTNSPSVPEARVRSTSVDSPLVRSPRGRNCYSCPEPIREPFYKPSDNGSSDALLQGEEDGSTSLPKAALYNDEVHSLATQFRSKSCTPMSRERWHQVASSAKERGGILGYELKALTDEMSELADDLRRLRAFVPPA